MSDSSQLSRREFFKRYSQPPKETLQLTQNCLNHHGVYCSSCRDECGESAIRVKPQLGGTLEILIDHDVCTHCMDCAKRCPNDALVLA